MPIAIADTRRRRGRLPLLALAGVLTFACSAQAHIPSGTARRLERDYSAFNAAAEAAKTKGEMPRLSDPVVQRLVGDAAVGETPYDWAEFGTLLKIGDVEQKVYDAYVKFSPSAGTPTAQQINANVVKYEPEIARVTALLVAQYTAELDAADALFKAKNVTAGSQAFAGYQRLDDDAVNDLTPYIGLAAEFDEAPGRVIADQLALSAPTLGSALTPANRGKLVAAAAKRAGTTHGAVQQDLDRFLVALSAAKCDRLCADLTATHATAASATAEKPPVAQYDAFLGHWEGHGRIFNPHSTDHYRQSRACTKVADGWAIRCEMVLQGKEGTLHQSTLIGVDRASGKAHYFTVTDAPAVKDDPMTAHDGEIDVSDSFPANGRTARIIQKWRIRKDTARENGILVYEGKTYRENEYRLTRTR